MRQLVDTVWQRRGTSWVWDEEARNPDLRGQRGLELASVSESGGQLAG